MAKLAKISPGKNFPIYNSAFDIVFLVSSTKSILQVVNNIINHMTQGFVSSLRPESQSTKKKMLASL